MLLTRVITALVLLPLVIGAIVGLPTAAVAVILAALLGVGAWEWAGLTCLNATPARAGFAGVAALAMAAAWWAPATLKVLILGAALVFWLLAMVMIRRFPRGWDLSVASAPLAGGLGLLLLVAAFVALVSLHAREQGPALVLFLLVLIWAADTGAYFSGRAFGRHKLAPRVSPGKTWAGAVGGMATALAAAGLGVWWFERTGVDALGLILLGAVVAVISIVGDLSMSLFKRQAGVKDSGVIFPGHGGVLDRLDSLLAAAPWFLLGLWLLAL